MIAGMQIRAQHELRVRWSAEGGSLNQRVPGPLHDKEVRRPRTVCRSRTLQRRLQEISRGR